MGSHLFSSFFFFFFFFKFSIHLLYKLNGPHPDQPSTPSPHPTPRAAACINNKSGCLPEQLANTEGMYLVSSDTLNCRPCSRTTPLVLFCPWFISISQRSKQEILTANNTDLKYKIQAFSVFLVTLITPE